MLNNFIINCDFSSKENERFEKTVLLIFKIVSIIVLVGFYQVNLLKLAGLLIVIGIVWVINERKEKSSYVISFSFIIPALKFPRIAKYKSVSGVRYNYPGNGLFQHYVWVNAYEKKIISLVGQPAISKERLSLFPFGSRYEPDKLTQLTAGIRKINPTALAVVQRKIAPHQIDGELQPQMLTGINYIVERKDVQELIEPSSLESRKKFFFEERYFDRIKEIEAEFIEMGLFKEEHLIYLAEFVKNLT